MLKAQVLSALHVPYGTVFVEDGREKESERKGEK